MTDSYAAAFAAGCGARIINERISPLLKPASIGTGACSPLSKTSTSWPGNTWPSTVPHGAYPSPVRRDSAWPRPSLASLRYSVRAGRQPASLRSPPPTVSRNSLASARASKSCTRFRQSPLRTDPGLGRSQQIHNAKPARGFTCDGHVRRIAPEGANVAPYPFESLNLIEQAVIARYPSDDSLLSSGWASQPKTPSR